MGPLDQINFVLNFVAPAGLVGTCLALFSPFIYGKRPAAPVFIAQAAINTVAGTLALAAGLWFFGRDAKVASYAAMLMACALSQVWAVRRP